MSKKIPDPKLYQRPTPLRVGLCAVLGAATLPPWLVCQAGLLSYELAPLAAPVCLALSLLAYFLAPGLGGGTLRELRHGAPGPACAHTLAFWLCFAGGAWQTWQAAQYNGRLAVIQLGEQQFTGQAAYSGAAFAFAALTVLVFLLERWACNEGFRARARYLRQKSILLPDEVRPVGGEQLLPRSEFHLNDSFVLREGERATYDARVLRGEGLSDESAITGARQPRPLMPGSTLRAGSRLVQGEVEASVIAGDAEGYLGRLCFAYDGLWRESDELARTPRAQPLFVVRLLLAVIVGAVWFLLSQSLNAACGGAACVLCAGQMGVLPWLRAAVTQQTANAMTDRGLLPAGCSVLVRLARLKTVVMTRDATVTSDTPLVSEIFARGLPERFLMGIAAALCIKGEHPLSASVMTYANEQNINVQPAPDFESHGAEGMTGRMSTKQTVAGGLDFVQQMATVGPEVLEKGRQMEENGCQTLYIALGGQAVGVLGCVPQISHSFSPAVAALRALSLHTVLLTQDEPRTAENLARQAGLDQVIPQLTPMEFAGQVSLLQSRGSTAMIGKLPQDAAALKRAAVDVALGLDANASLSLLDEQPISLADAVSLARTMQPRRQALHKKAVLIGCLTQLAAIALPVLGGPAPALAVVGVVNALASRQLLKKALRPGSAAPQEAQGDA